MSEPQDNPRKPRRTWKRGPIQKGEIARGEANWSKACKVCGGKPVVAGTELCGPCCFGEAGTAGGEW